VAAVRIGSTSVAYPFSRLRDRRAVNDRVEGTAIVVFWEPGTASALDAPTVDSGRDVGTTGVFLRTVDSRPLTFVPEVHGFRDTETGSTWDLTGRAIAGPLRGTRLDPVPHGDYFWFAWAAFRPDTDIRP
jgi:hypothetical protein